MGNVLSAFRRGDLQKRMRASAISGRRQNLEGLLASATVGAGLWIVTIVAAMAIYRGGFIRSSGFIYYLLNALMMLLVALALSYLIGIVAKNTNMLNGIVNVLSLGMSFLCGVFVPLGYMNPSVRKVAMFLPVYWYEKANDLLTGFRKYYGNGACRGTAVYRHPVCVHGSSGLCDLALAKRSRVYKIFIKCL